MKKLSISEARARLPELARMLVRERNTVAYISHRDLDDELALTTRSHIEHLERTIEALRKRPRKPFKLIGSMTTHLTDEELEAALARAKADAQAAVEKRLRELAE